MKEMSFLTGFLKLSKNCNMDFFQPECQHPPLTDKEFGLCDDQDSTPAYCESQDKSKWIATVKNDNEKEVTFTAIDKCLIQDDDEQGVGRCDGMLTSNNLLFLVELKDRQLGRNWKNDAIEQLSSTINLLKRYHDISGYRHKKAFVCNKKCSKFTVIDNEQNKTFFKEHGFRLDVQGTIVIIP